jgi:hypothetical protein
VSRYWEEEAWVSIEGATFAFADPSIVDDNLRTRVLLGDTSGLPIVVFNSGADGEVPIEVVFDDSHVILAMRMCVTDDVDELDGNWVTVGELTIGDHGCVALDPTSPAEPSRYTTMSLPAGTYIAEAFEFTDDEGVTVQLAIRLRRPDMSTTDLELEREMDADGTLVIEVVMDEDGNPGLTDYIIDKKR